MFRCVYMCCLFLAVSGFLILPADTAVADCNAYSNQLNSLDGQINQGAAQSNAMNAELVATIDEFNAYNNVEVEPGSKEMLEILRTMQQLMGRAISICEQRIQVQKGLLDLWEQGYSLAQAAVNEGCYEPGLLDGVAQGMDGERSVLSGTEQVCAPLPEVYAQLSNDIAELESTAGQNDDPPTVRIVNNMSIPACIHPGGQSAGMCIDPGVERVYRMDKLTGLDTDSGQRTPTKTIVVVGGGVWEGSPYTEYQGMTVCLKQRFGHQSGEVVWRISGGLEQNCGIRGYHQ